ncbi:MAG: polysaccharide biosynthesis protein [Lachnospiraceae bacterium]|nr:polysaccharide biosynthesis protein [Lachnospiraceae bacterium]
MASKSNSGNFLRQGSILAATSILVRLIGMLYRIPLANIIGDEGNGIYSPAYEVYSLLLILSSNAMPLAVSKMVSEKMAKRKYQETKKVFKCSLIFASCTGGICALFLFFGADFLERVFYSKLAGINIPFKILAPTIFIVAILGVLRGFFEGNKTMIPTAFSQVIEQIVNAFISVYAAYMFIYLHSASPYVSAWGAAGGTMGTCIGAFSALIIMILLYILFGPYFIKLFKKDKRKHVLDTISIFKLVIVTVTPIILSQTVYQLSGTIDTILFNKFMDIRDINVIDIKKMLGIYSTDYRLLVNVPIAISTAICSSMIPSLVRAYVNKEKDIIESSISLAIKFNMIIAIPSAFGLAILGKPILQLIFSNTDINMGSIMLMTGSSCIIFYSLSTVTSGVLQSVNKMRVPVINAAISLVLHIILVILLIAFTGLGPYALVVGNVTYPLVVCILNAFSLKKYIGFKQEIKNTFIAPILVSVGMSVVTIIVCYGLIAITHKTVIGVLIGVMVAVTLYFVGILKSKCLTKDELFQFPYGRTMYTIAVRFKLMK